MSPKNQSVAPSIDMDNLPIPAPPQYKGIDINQVIALRRKNLSMQQIATLLGCSAPNITQRLNAIGYHIDRLADFKGAKADRFELELSKLIDSITDADRKKATYYNKILSAGILVDKIQLLTGQPTSFIAYADVIKSKEQAKITLDEVREIHKQRHSDADSHIQPDSANSSPSRICEDSVDVDIVEDSQVSDINEDL